MILTGTQTTAPVGSAAVTAQAPVDVSAPQGFQPGSNGESWIALPSPSAAVLPVTYASTTTLNWAAGGIFTVTLTGDVTFAFSNAMIGQSVRIVITQDGTGSRTGTFPTGSVFVGGSKTLTTTASAIDTVDVQCTAQGTYLCSLLKAYA